MKKVISIALAAAMATSLVACGGSAASSTAPAASAEMRAALQTVKWEDIY